MSKMNGWSGLAGLAALVLSGGAWAVAYDANKWNMPVGVTEISREAYRQHMNIFWICCVIGVLVFSVMIYSIIRHRRSVHPKPADFHESTTVEIAWTVVPFLILVAMAIPAAGALIKMEDVRGAEMSVKVTGYQWKWHYEYVGEDVAFYSTLHPDHNLARQRGSGVDPAQVQNYLLEVDNRVVLPTGRKIRFLLTANDVIHAWWVPDIGMKKDAIPGFINEMWAIIDEPGIYRGVCAELCGRDHGFMPIVVEAVEPAVYEQWLADRKAGKPTQIGHGPAPLQLASAGAVPASAPAQPTAAAAQQAQPAATAAPTTAETPPAAESPQQVAAAPRSQDAPAFDPKQGEKVYNAQCAACHQATGQGMPPTFPSLVNSALVNGPAEAHIQQTLKGRGAMPPFAHLSNADIAAAISYERTSWGNTGGAVTAEQVAAQRGK